MDSNDKQLPMVGWFDFKQLAKTTRETLISTILGEHADGRILESVSHRRGTVNIRASQPGAQPGASKRPDDTQSRSSEDEEADATDYSSQKELWLDYVADVGDGFNSTYSVAYCLSQPKLMVRGVTENLPRGHILIFGGDEVYPYASRENYRERLENPYSWAFQTLAPGACRPDAYAIPGNHDWYDSLQNFTRIFRQSDYFPLPLDDGTRPSKEGGWRVPQDRSYFVLKLPHNWWLVGVDTQLGSDLDDVQIQYFRDKAMNMKPHDRIILCCAEPYWLYAQVYGVEHKQEAFLQSRLCRRYLENQVFSKQEVKLYLTGDLHHYRRYEEVSPHNNDPAQRIICGGGGAFLHPTCGPFAETLDYESCPAMYPPIGKVVKFSSTKPDQTYPSVAECEALIDGILRFPLINPTFALLTAVVYGLYGWFLISAMAFRGGQAVVHTTSEILYAFLESALRTPTVALLFVVLVTAFWQFTDTVQKFKVASFVHGVAHFAAILGISALAYLTTFVWVGAEWSPILKLASTGALVTLGGLVVGPTLMGIYLWASYRFWKRHSNEAFSALRIEDYKSFLRLHIDGSGRLTVYPIKIPRVGRSWKEAGPESVSKYRSADIDLAPEVIERPFSIGRPKSP